MILVNYIIKHIMSKQDVLLAIRNFRGLKSLSYNAKIRTSLKFLLIQYIYHFSFSVLFFFKRKWDEIEIRKVFKRYREMTFLKSQHGKRRARITKIKKFISVYILTWWHLDGHQYSISSSPHCRNLKLWHCAGLSRARKHPPCRWYP